MQLTLAEDAHQAGDLDSVYMAQRNMAQYFEQSGDTWLSDHFYNRCLETGKLVRWSQTHSSYVQFYYFLVQVQGDNGYKEGEAHCHVGLALENRGDFLQVKCLTVNAMVNVSICPCCLSLST